MAETTRPRTIFISYRREDTKAEAGRLYDRLAGHFDAERVFMDVATIDGGRDFAERITNFIASCDVLVALIGSKWLTIVDANGLRRIDDPHDFVRLEIETALRSGVAVIPVLVQGASGLQTDDLPPPIQTLMRLHMLKLTHEDFPMQASRLIESIERLPRRRRPTVEATSLGFRWMAIVVRLNEEHRIALDKSRLFGTIKVDGQIIVKKWLLSDGQYALSIVDGNRPLPAVISFFTSGEKFRHVMLTINGATVYDSASDAAHKPEEWWREHGVVTKVTPIGVKVMYIVLKLHNEHTIYIDNTNTFGHIEIDGQRMVKKFSLMGEHDLAIKDGDRLVPASIALDISMLNNLSKVVLTVEGDIVYAS